MLARQNYAAPAKVRSPGISQGLLGPPALKVLSAHPGLRVLLALLVRKGLRELKGQSVRPEPQVLRGLLGHLGSQVPLARLVLQALPGHQLRDSMTQTGNSSATSSV